MDQLLLGEPFTEDIPGQRPLENTNEPKYDTPEFRVSPTC